MIETVKPLWKMRMHMNCGTKHHLLYRDDALRVQKEVHTSFRNGIPGKGKTYYFIDNDEREFRTEESLIEALRERSE